MLTNENTEKESNYGWIECKLNNTLEENCIYYDSLEK